MRRRLTAACAALLLLIAGTVVLLAYVRGADARALAGVQTVEVLVADQVIPAGTTADELTALVRTEALPRKAAVEGRVPDLEALRGLVATVDVQPGEQLLAARFGEEDAAGGPEGTVPVPPGLQEVSVLLEPQRAVGGRLAAGDTAGVVISLSEGRTRTVLHQVLVTEVKGAPAPVQEDPGAPETAAATVPNQSLMITFAVTAAEAEAVVFGMEHGTVWLTLENEDADTSGTDVVDAGTIYEKDFS